MNISTFANTERLRSRAEALRILGLKAPHGDFHWAQELGAGGMTDTLVSSRSAAEGMHTHARREPGAELELDERWRHFLLGQKALMQEVADGKDRRGEYLERRDSVVGIAGDARQGLDR